jgi:hypothetical protein
MPKQLHEIKRFQSGTITTPSERDIPEDSASYSKNIDSVTEDGKLKSIPNDLEVHRAIKASGSFKFKTNPSGSDSIEINGVTINFVEI